MNSNQYTREQLNQDLKTFLVPFSALMLSELKDDDCCPHCKQPLAEEIKKNPSVGLTIKTADSTDNDGEPVIAVFVAHQTCHLAAGEKGSVNTKDAVAWLDARNPEMTAAKITTEIVKLIRHRCGKPDAPVVLNTCNLTRALHRRASGSFTEMPLLFSKADSPSPEVEIPIVALGPFEDTDPPFIIGKMAEQSVILHRAVLAGQAEFTCSPFGRSAFTHMTPEVAAKLLAIETGGAA